MKENPNEIQHIKGKYIIYWTFQLVKLIVHNISVKQELKYT